MTPISVLGSMLLCGLLASCASAEGELEAVDKAEFNKIFAPQATIRTLVDNLQFSEGPVWVAGKNGYLVFSDIPANKLLKWHPKTGLSVFRNPSHNANGNTTDLKGQLVTCEHGGRRGSIATPDGSLDTLVGSYNGKKFNSPNDVVVKSDGTIWFTDPDYGLADRTKEQAGNYVYRFDRASGKVTVLVKDFDKPNGLCFSPDERRLYIADSGSPRHIRVFTVTAEGALSAGKLFAKLDRGGPDGIRCDAEGRIWSSSGDGAQVFTPAGKLVARVKLPKAGANLCFGGPDGRTLFVTARNGLYAVDTRVVAAGR